MKIEVGKTYVQFNGGVVKIVSHDGSGHLPFYGDDDCWRFENGRYCSEYFRSDQDENGSMDGDISHELEPTSYTSPPELTLLRRIFDNNPSLNLGEGELNQAELDLLRGLRG